MISIPMHFLIFGITNEKYDIRKSYKQHVTIDTSVNTLRLVSLADTLKTFSSKRRFRSGVSLTPIIHISINVMHL